METLKRKVLSRRFSLKKGDSKYFPDRTHHSSIYPPYPFPISACASIRSFSALSIADYHSYEDADEETAAHLQKEIEEAEKNNHDTGKPGSFLNRLINHGNRKTEEELRREVEKGRGRKGGS